MNKGRIIKGIGGFYTIEQAGECYTCHARGLFRLKKIKPMVGDWVDFAPPDGEQGGVILDILPRSNALKRPSVANVDLLVVTIAADQPSPDLLLADRILAQAVELGLKTALCINKADLVAPAMLEEYRIQYRHLPWVVYASYTDVQGYEELSRRVMGQTICFAGQSGVGKSTLVNALVSQQEMVVGALSGRTRRGKHTTRHVELLPLPQGGYVVDTPGFSLLEMDVMDPNHLAELYPDFAPYRDQCRFTGCLHDKEPDCCVKRAVQEDKIDKTRYQRYIALLEDSKERWKSRYD
jgi:ribosome biogenesis GTPase